MKTFIYILPVFALTLFSITIVAVRSPHRPIDLNDPSLSVSWAHKPSKTYYLTESHLTEILFKTFDKQYFESHQLPTEKIYYRYDPTKYVLGTTLRNLIEGLLEEIKNGKKKYAHFITQFTILKNRDFTRKHLTGVLILKFKDYPFVLKLFIETPKSFVLPHTKGFEPSCFFYMGGGVSRHISGFTRIKNLENIKKQTQSDPFWATRIAFPRKWFWIPQNSAWLSITGYNIGSQKTINTTIPAVYGIICDEIEWERQFTLSRQDDKRTAMALSNFVHQSIDPHINNFGIEKNTGKIVPIDFEHFPTVVGISPSKKCRGYWQWYSHLSCKMLHDTFCRSKSERRRQQYRLYEPLV